MSEQDARGIELHSRLDTVERSLEALRREVADVRTLAGVSRPVTQPRAPSTSVEPPAPPRRPVERPRPAAPASAPVVRARRSSEWSPRELVERWQLMGPRGFAIVGGAVTALGIGLLFALAANRGWIGPAERVVLGAIASLLVFGAGIAVRARFGQLHAALAAVGAGAAGGYATLAAATARYDLVPETLALPLAAAIAAATTAVALTWGSQILAGIGLVGSALAPALQSIDTGMTPGSAAFAVIVLGATAVVSGRRRWQPLLASVAGIVTVQVLALVTDRDWIGDTAAVAVGVALATVLLGSGVALRHGRGNDELQPLDAALPLVGTGVALLTAASLLATGRDRGIVLFAVAGVWAGAWIVLQARDRALAFVVAVSALALGAAATVALLSDDALTVVWAAQAILLSIVAKQLRDARMRLCALAYVGLAAAHTLVIDALPTMLFDPSLADAAASATLAASALAALAWGLTAPRHYAAKTETGVLAFLAGVRITLERRRAELAESAVFAAGALGVLAVAVLLTGLSFEAGHVASSGLAAAAAAAALATGAGRRSAGLIVASLVALVAVVVETGFDADQFLRDDQSSVGGWSMLLAAAGLLAGGFALRVLHPTTQRLGIISGIAASAALALSIQGLALVVPRVDAYDPNEMWMGVGLAVAALVYGALAASVFRAGRLRNLSTTLWATGVVAALAAEAFLLQDGRLLAAAAAASGGLLALASPPLREIRLAVAGAIVTGLATLGTLAFVTPLEQFLKSNPAPADGLWVLVVCVAGAVSVAIALAPLGRDARRVSALVVGALALYALSLAVLDFVGRLSGAGLETDFERGHTAVSALWALIGLAGLVAGLVRGSTPVRLAGLVLLGVSLAKIFLFDLAELSSVARAASFIAVGAAILAGGAVLQKLSARLEDARGEPAGTAS